MTIANPRGPAGSLTYRHITRPLLAIVSRDNGRWHLSLSHMNRVPTWEELGMARDALLPPDVHFMVPHPPRRYWINANRRVLHLWEHRDQELADMFEWEGEETRELLVNNPPDGGTEP